MSLLRRRMIMKGGIDDRIKVLLHLDGNIVDERGNAVTTSNTYGTQYVEGKFGQCVDIADGATSYGFNLKVQDLFGSVPSRFTVECWSKRANEGVANCPNIAICSRGTSWTNYGVSGMVVALTVTSQQGGRFAYSPNGAWGSLTYVAPIAGVTTHEAGVWRHYAVTYDNGVITWFFNGNKVGEATMDHSQVALTGNALGFHQFRLCDEFAFSNEILYAGDTYTVPSKPYK